MQRELSNYAAGLNYGHLVMPVIQIDKEILINPSNQELGEAVERAAAERDSGRIRAFRRIGILRFLLDSRSM